MVIIVAPLPQITVTPMLTRAVGTHDSAIMGENPKVDMNEVEVEIEVKLNKVEHDKVEELEQPKWTRVFDGKSMIKIEESEVELQSRD